jgi:PAS domain-containing protein
MTQQDSLPGEQDDDAAEAVAVACLDGTEREPGARTHARTRRTREDEMRALVEQLPDAVARHDPATRIVYANPAWTRLVGCADAVPGRRIGEVAPGSTAVARYQRALDHVAASGEPAELDFIGAAGGRAAARLRSVRRAMLVELVAEIRAARARDLRGVQRTIRRLTTLTHAATAAATAAGLRVCGHELDRGLAASPA